MLIWLLMAIEWRLTGFYGFPGRRRRRESWNLLRALSRRSNLPEAIEDCQLTDIPLEGYPNTWDRGRGHSKLGSGKCSTSLSQWGRHLATKFKAEVRECHNNIRVLRPLMDTESVQAYSRCREKLAWLLAREEYWKQRAKLFWLKEGDSNTKHFHAMTSSRRKANKLTKLIDDSDEEFKEAVFSMSPDKFIKSPGLDGLNPKFYQHFWSIIGADICVACRGWLANKEFPPLLRDTLLVLIPKCDNPQMMKELRLIALCNVLCMIIAKVLANRLKVILDDIISTTQAAFVPGRSITDNVVVGFESIHSMKRHTRGKELSHLKWTSAKRMTGVTYSVCLNGHEVGPIKHFRGLRQRDPLSPTFSSCAVRASPHCFKRLKKELFEPFGTVELVQLPLDLGTGQCKGFGFVQVGDHNLLSIAKFFCAI
ncbi:hypothetical protein NC652_029532 [Populus alba x Populus x berolinensis]|nr:hypothetical protein NC652_029532 [Populus alba x Populus x berolinensis]